jgi:hypothetical protein
VRNSAWVSYRRRVTSGTSLPRANAACKRSEGSSCSGDGSVPVAPRRAVVEFPGPLVSEGHLDLSGQLHFCLANLARVRSPWSPTSCTASLSEAYSVVHRLCVPYLTARARAIIPFSRSSIPLRRGWRSCRAAYICWETCAWPLRAPLNPGALVGTLPAHQVVSSAVL